MPVALSYFFVGRIKFASLEANLGEGLGLSAFSLFHSSFLSPSLWEESQHD